MATINLVLDTRRARRDNTYPLVFRVRIEKKYCDIATGFSFREDQFDTKTSSVKNDATSNDLLDQLKNHYSKRLKTYIVNNLGKEDIKDARDFLVNKLPDEITIMDFWKQHVEELKNAKRYGGARVYETVLSLLSQETNLYIPFKSFSYKTLMMLEQNLYRRGLTANSISVYMRSFRAICNKAINYDIVNYDWYPFRKYKMKKTKTTPRILKSEEIQAYFSLNIQKDHTCYKSWLIGKLIFMLRGINVKDLLLLSSSNIKGDRIIYKRSKTGKVYSIKILPEVAEILMEFNSNSTLLGLITEKDQVDPVNLVKITMQRRKVINEHLNKIHKLLKTKEPITTYVFRYSYANIAKQLGYSKDLIAEALGHEYGNSVTGIYLEQFDLELIDEMNRRIIMKINNDGAL
jgi:integrase/recombinase XerD